MIVRDFPAAQYGVTRLCVKYYQIEDSPLLNTFSLSFPFWFNTEGFQIFYKRWRTENWYADADADEEPTELKKKPPVFQKKYFETKLGTCLYLEILLSERFAFL